LSGTAAAESGQEYNSLFKEILSLLWVNPHASH
jgi:hypothetical protein